MAARCRALAQPAVRPEDAAARAVRLVAGKFDAFLQPGLIFFGRINYQRSLHRVVAEAAKLAADHFEGASLDRPEPHRDDLPRNGILRDPHIG